MAASILSRWGPQWWTDTAERVIGGFVSTLIPVWVASTNISNLDFRDALVVSAGSAGLVFLKCVLANTATGDMPSASLVGVSSATVSTPLAETAQPPSSNQE